MTQTKGTNVAIVCGGRDFNDVGYMAAVMTECVKMFDLGKVIQGGAHGADKLAGQWASENWLDMQVVPADWDTHGKAAGFIRNTQMADLNPDVVIAFPGGKGTEHMINIARERRIPVFIV